MVLEEDGGAGSLYIEYASSCGHIFSSFFLKGNPKHFQEDILVNFVTKRDVSDDVSFPALIINIMECLFSILPVF